MVRNYDDPFFSAWRERRGGVGGVRNQMREIELPDAEPAERWKHAFVPRDVSIPHHTEPFDPFVPTPRLVPTPRRPKNATSLRAIVALFSLRQRLMCGLSLDAAEHRAFESLRRSLSRIYPRSRRVWRRFEADLPVEFGAHGRGRVEDLSVGGIRIHEAFEVPCHGDRIEVVFDVPLLERTRRISVPGRVAWTYAPGRSFAVRFGSLARWLD